MNPHTRHYEIYVREVCGLPADWTLSAICFLKSVAPSQSVQVSGAVYGRYVQGPKKGKVNYRKVDPGTFCERTVTMAEVVKWFRQREVRTGDCADCLGEGRLFVSWSVDSGTVHRTCPRCGGTGRVVAA